MEQIFFLILLAVVGLLRWISQMAEEKRNREAEKRAPGIPPLNTPVQRAPAETEEERVRRFMEALGVPTTNAPIPKAEPTRETPKPPAAPKRKVNPIDPFPRGGFPPITTAPAPPPPPLPQAPPLVPQPPRVPAAPSPLPVGPPPLPTRETTMFAPTPAAEFEVRDVTEAIDELPPTGRGQLAAEKRGAARESALAARLRSPEGLRDAIVLLEIFGPPRSMQPLDAGRG